MWNVGELPWSWFLGAGLKFTRSLKRERKIRRRFFTFSITREIRHFHVVVVKWRQRNVQKSVIHVQTGCFANQIYCFFAALVAVAVVVAKAPYWSLSRRPIMHDAKGG